MNNSLDDAKNNFKNIITSYRSLGLNLPSQTLYPDNYIIGGAFSFPATKNFYLGLDFNHTQTKAFSLYSDKAGAFDLSSTIVSNKFGASCRFVFNQENFISPYFELITGLLFVDYDLTANLSLTPPLQLNSKNRITASGMTAFLDFSFGLNQKLSGIYLFEKIAYHFGSIDEMEALMKSDESQTNGKLKDKYDFSGFSIEFGIGLLL
jgi:hypothetical protein